MTKTKDAIARVNDALTRSYAQDHVKDCDCEPCLIRDARADMDPSHIIGVKDSWVVCLSHQMTLMASSGGIGHDEPFDQFGIEPLDHHLGTCHPMCGTCDSVLMAGSVR